MKSPEEKNRIYPSPLLLDTPGVRPVTAGERLHPEALVLARDAQFHICSPTGEQGPGALSMTDAVPYEPIGCIHESVQTRVVLLYAEVCEIVALTTGEER